MTDRMPIETMSDEELTKRVESIITRARSKGDSGLRVRHDGWEPRRVKIEEIEAVTADYRRRNGIPDRVPGQHRTPAELAALLQAQGERLDRLSRLMRENFPPDPDKVP